MWTGGVGLGRPGLQRPLELRKNLVGICGMERSRLSLEDAEGGEDRDGEKEEALGGVDAALGDSGSLDHHHPRSSSPLLSAPSP